MKNYCLRFVIVFTRHKDPGIDNCQQERDSIVQELRDIVANQKDRIKALKASIEANNLHLYASNRVLVD